MCNQRKVFQPLDVLVIATSMATVIRTNVNATPVILEARVKQGHNAKTIVLFKAFASTDFANAILVSWAKIVLFLLVQTIVLDTVDALVDSAFATVVGQKTIAQHYLVRWIVLEEVSAPARECAVVRPAMAARVVKSSCVNWIVLRMVIVSTELASVMLDGMGMGVNSRIALLGVSMESV